MIAVNPSPSLVTALEKWPDHSLIVTADPTWREPETTVAIVQAWSSCRDTRHPVWFPFEPETWGVWPDTANSGLVALWLAWQLGADPILLAGFDGGPDASGRTHYHKTVSPPDLAFYARSRAALEELAPQIRHRVFHLVEPVNRQELGLWNATLASVPAWAREPLESRYARAEADGVELRREDSTGRPPVSVVMACMEERREFRAAFVMPPVEHTAPEVLLVRGDGRRPTEALNIGLRHATQPFVLFLDDDCVLAADTLARLFAALEADPGAAVAYGDYMGIVHPGATPHPCGPVWLQRTGPWDVAALRDRNLVPSIALWRRSLLPRDPPWDESIERLYDWDLALALAEKGGRGVYVPGVLFHAHWLPGATETNDSAESAKKREASKALIRERHRAFLEGR